MSGERDWELWRSGCPLSNAQDRFCDQNHVKELKAVQASDPQSQMWRRLPEFMKELTTTREVSAEMLKLARERDKGNELAQLIRNEFWNKLLGGFLAAYGYVVPRRATDLPCRVPPDVLEGEYFWSEDRIKGNGMEFVAIRIVATNVVSDVEGHSQKSRVIGRPSRVREIDAAWEALLRQGKIRSGVPLASIFPLIRRKVLELFPDTCADTKGLGNKLLYRVLSPKYQNLTKVK